MGLAASQARLLSITQRMSDNELRAQMINNQKMRLSAESSQVSENYVNALNKTNLVFSNYDSEDNAQSVPLTFNNLTAFNQYNNQYGLTNTAGQILISEKEARIYNESKDTTTGAPDLEEYLRRHNIEKVTSYWTNISDQLKDAEDFYTDPNGNGIVEPRVGSAPKGSANYGDGDFKTFFNAENLEKMFLGEPPYSQSYETTIQTSEYTDFVSYANDFAEIQGAIVRANNAKANVLGKYFNETHLSLSSVSLSGTTVANLTTINSELENCLNANFNTSGATIPTIDQSEIDAWFTERGIRYDSTLSRYISDLSLEDALGTSQTWSTTVASPNPSANSLYCKRSDGNYYMRIDYDMDDDGTKYKSIWMKIGTTFPTSPSSRSLSDKTYYTWNGSNWSTDGSADSAKISKVTYGGVDYYELQHTDSENGETSTKGIMYNVNGSSSSVNSYETFTTGEIQTQLDKHLLELAKNKFIEFGKTADVNTGSTAYQALSDEEKEAIKKASTSGSAEIDDLVAKLKECLFTNPTSGAPASYTAEQMLAILNYLTSGVEWQNSGSVTLNDTHNDFTLNWGDLKSSMQNVINAYTLDMVFDIFGEPRYTYLYTDGNGNVDTSKGTDTDASAEAKWLTNLFTKIQKSGYQMLPNGLASSREWIQFALENGIVTMTQVDSEDVWQGITHTSCSDILEETASNVAAIAEAEYNKAMRQIEAKDEMFDLELKNIDTEHSALQNEYESVKKAMTGNVERTFQMYS